MENKKFLGNKYVTVARYFDYSGTLKAAVKDHTGKVSGVNASELSHTRNDVPEEDTQAPVIGGIDNVTAVEGTAITDIIVTTDDESAVINVSGLPAGVTFEEGTATISGTPTVDNWGADEEERTTTITVTATDEADNTSEETFDIIVQRDTDGDGIPDVNDDDDDNDGATDAEEIEAGTDSKDENDVPKEEPTPEPTPEPEPEPEVPEEPEVVPEEPVVEPEEPVVEPEEPEVPVGEEVPVESDGFKTVTAINTKTSEETELTTEDGLVDFATENELDLDVIDRVLAGEQKTHKGFEFK